MLYNVLDYPAGVVPVTEENEHDQDKLENYIDPVCKLIKEASHSVTNLK